MLPLIEDQRYRYSTAGFSLLCRRRCPAEATRLAPARHVRDEKTIRELTRSGEDSAMPSLPRTLPFDGVEASARLVAGGCWSLHAADAQPQPSVVVGLELSKAAETCLGTAGRTEPKFSSRIPVTCTLAPKGYRDGLRFERDHVGMGTRGLLVLRVGRLCAVCSVRSIVCQPAGRGQVDAMDSSDK